MSLMKKIVSGEATVGIIGLGYVGLPLAIAFAKSGYNVIGFDVNDKKIGLLLAGKAYVSDVDSGDIKTLVEQGKFMPTTNFGKISELDTVSICVPTPLTKSKNPDISYIVKALNMVKKYFHKELLIVLESTTYPGMTEELIQKSIENMGYKVGKDFYLCFSPERIDPGNKNYSVKNTPKVIGGITTTCVELACTLYSNIIDRVVPVSSTKVAETVKLLENTFRAVNIGLVNELLMMCDRMEIDIWEVINAASTKPFGFMQFYPGPGVGGHCIPLDSQYLSWKAKTYNFYNRFIELASDINGNMPRYVVIKVGEILNKEKICINGSRILILGITYKKDVNDFRESPALEIYELLKRHGAIVKYSDPYVQEFTDEYNISVSSVELDYNKLKDYDCIILCTDHSCYNYEKIAKNAKIIVDTRDAFKGIINSKIYRIGSPLNNVNTIEFHKFAEKFINKNRRNCK